MVDGELCPECANILDGTSSFHVLCVSNLCTKLNVWGGGRLYIAWYLLLKQPCSSLLQVYKQQHAFERWRDNPILKDGVALLSSSCVDLLDSMFAKNEADRWVHS